MAEDIKNLIEKIQQEGIKAAEEKAKEIEAQAQHRAEALIQKAQKEAQGLIAEAKDKVARMEKSARALLEQTGRDLLLALREEINAMLNRLVVSHLRRALTPRELINIITTLIKNSNAEEKDIIVSLSKNDLKNLENGFLGELHDVTKKGITLKTSSDIHGGFLISYDSDKSHYDFTDKALAQYLGLRLKPELAAMLKEVASGVKKGAEK